MKAQIIKPCRSRSYCCSSTNYFFQIQVYSHFTCIVNRRAAFGCIEETTMNCNPTPSSTLSPTNSYCFVLCAMRLTLVNAWCEITIVANSLRNTAHPRSVQTTWKWDCSPRFKTGKHYWKDAKPEDLWFWTLQEHSDIVCIYDLTI